MQLNDFNFKNSLKGISDDDSTKAIQYKKNNVNRNLPDIRQQQQQQHEREITSIIKNQNFSENNSSFNSQKDMEQEYLKNKDIYRKYN